MLSPMLQHVIAALQPPPPPTTMCISFFTVHHHTGRITQHKVVFEAPHLAWKRVWKEADRNGTAVMCARVASLAAWRADAAAAFSVAKPIPLDSLAVIDNTIIDANHVLAVRLADAPGRKKPAAAGLHRC